MFISVNSKAADDEWWRRMVGRRVVEVVKGGSETFLCIISILTWNGWPMRQATARLISGSRKKNQQQQQQ